MNQAGRPWKFTVKQYHCEVYGSTLRYDRNKLDRYAATRIPEVWSFKLWRKIFEVYR